MWFFVNLVEKEPHLFLLTALGYLYSNEGGKVFFMFGYYKFPFFFIFFNFYHKSNYLTICSEIREKGLRMKIYLMYSIVIGCLKILKDNRKRVSHQEMDWDWLSATIW